MVAEYDCVVIGAGEYGLGASYFLQQLGVQHIVLDRGHVGETWRTQRWDSFRLNTPNWASALPGMPFKPSDPGGFSGAADLVIYFEEYRAAFELPIREGVEVVAVEQADRGFHIETSESALESHSIVVASGGRNHVVLPSLSKLMPQSVTQLHSADYRNPDRLPPGAVLLVGGAQSGCQIAEELLRAGREVYLSTSRVGRAPRRYRGRDIFEWFEETGHLDARPPDGGSPAPLPPPEFQLSGVDGGHAVSYQQLAREGAMLLGRLFAVVANDLLFEDDLLENVRYADECFAELTQMIDEYIDRASIDSPAADGDPDEAGGAILAKHAHGRQLDLANAGITTVIWCTGIGGDLTWLHLSVLDEFGQPRHVNGVAQVPGVYFLGLPWLRSRRSGSIIGVNDDARHVVTLVRLRLERER